MRRAPSEQGWTLEELADIVGDVVGSNTPEGQKLLGAVAEIERLNEVIERASTHLHNIAIGLEELRDLQRRSKVLESDKPLPDNLIPSAAIYGKAIRMTQRDLAAAL